MPLEDPECRESGKVQACKDDKTPAWPTETSQHGLKECKATRCHLATDQVVCRLYRRRLVGVEVDQKGIKRLETCSVTWIRSGMNEFVSSLPWGRREKETSSYREVYLVGKPNPELQNQRHCNVLHQHVISIMWHVIMTCCTHHSSLQSPSIPNQQGRTEDKKQFGCSQPRVLDGEIG